MTEAYFQLNAEEYAGLIDRMVTEVTKLNPASHHDLSQARQAYIMTALARGAILADLPQTIARLDLEQLKKQKVQYRIGRR